MKNDINENKDNYGSYSLENQNYYYLKNINDNSKGYRRFLLRTIIKIFV